MARVKDVQAVQATGQAALAVAPTAGVDVAPHASGASPGPGRAGALAALAAALNGAFFERGEAVRALMLAVIAGQHAIMLGPPGTAKSELARALASATGLGYWETLLTRFSTPEDVFGPVKLSALQRDTYERATGGTMVDAEIGFVDECFKANAAILNALLTILNERVFHNGPASRLSVPLVSCIGASNELPESAEELGALWDRFLVRIHVGYLAEADHFDALCFEPRVAVPRVAVDVRAEQAAAGLVTIHPDVRPAYREIREACKRDGRAVSDRRWRQAVSLVRASAHLDGRTVAETDDLDVLESVLWNAPDERGAVAQLVQRIVNPSGARAVQYADDAAACVRDLPAEGKGTKAEQGAACAEANATLAEIKAKIDALGKGRKVAEQAAKVDAFLASVNARASRLYGVKL